MVLTPSVNDAGVSSTYAGKVSFERTFRVFFDGPRFLKKFFCTTNTSSLFIQVHVDVDTKSGLQEQEHAGSIP